VGAIPLGKGEERANRRGLFLQGGDGGKGRCPRDAGREMGGKKNIKLRRTPGVVVHIVRPLHREEGSSFLLNAPIREGGAIRKKERGITMSAPSRSGVHCDRDQRKNPKQAVTNCSYRLQDRKGGKIDRRFDKPASKKKKLKDRERNPKREGENQGKVEPNAATKRRRESICGEQGVGEARRRMRRKTLGLGAESAVRIIARGKISCFTSRKGTSCEAEKGREKKQLLRGAPPWGGGNWAERPEREICFPAQPLQRSSDKRNPQGAGRASTVIG